MENRNIRKDIIRTILIVLIVLVLTGLVALCFFLKSKYVRKPLQVQGEYAAIARVMKAQHGLDTGSIIYIRFQDTPAFNAGIGSVIVVAMYDPKVKMFDEMLQNILSVDCVVLRPDELQKTFGIEGYASDANIIPMRKTPMYNQFGDNGVKLSGRFEMSISLGWAGYQVGNVSILYGKEYVRLGGYIVENHSGFEVEQVYQVIGNGKRPRINIVHYVMHVVV